MDEYQHFDGETFITFDIVSVNERTKFHHIKFFITLTAIP